VVVLCIFRSPTWQARVRHEQGLLQQADADGETFDADQAVVDVEQERVPLLRAGQRERLVAVLSFMSSMIVINGTT
jgi:hypothetical protein